MEWVQVWFACSRAAGDSQESAGPIFPPRLIAIRTFILADSIRKSHKREGMNSLPQRDRRQPTSEDR